MQGTDQNADDRFELLARAANAACWDWNLTKDEVAWSATITSMFGYPRGEIGNAEAWKERIHPDDRDRVLAGVNAVLEKGDIYEGEYRFLSASGKYVHIFDRGAVVRDAN